MSLSSDHRTRIKICGLTREADVDAAVEAGADAIGFVLYEKSARHVESARAAELARRLPPFVTPVLLLVNATPALLQMALAAVPQALLQFHGDESPAQCEALTEALPRTLEEIAERITEHEVRHAMGAIARGEETSAWREDEPCPCGSGRGFSVCCGGQRVLH